MLNLQLNHQTNITTALSKTNTAEKVTDTSDDLMEETEQKLCMKSVAPDVSGSRAVTSTVAQGNSSPPSLSCGKQQLTTATSSTATKENKQLRKPIQELQTINHYSANKELSQHHVS